MWVNLSKWVGERKAFEILVGRRRLGGTSQGRRSFLVSLQALFSILDSSEFQQPLKWEKPEMGAKGKVFQGRRKKVSKSRDHVDAMAFVVELELGGC